MLIIKTIYSKFREKNFLHFYERQRKYIYIAFHKINLLKKFNVEISS